MMHGPVNVKFEYKYLLYKCSILMSGSTHILLHNLTPVSYIYKLNDEQGPVPWRRGDR